MIKKILLVMLIISVILPLVCASPLSIEKAEKGNVVVTELHNPAIFEFTINNPDQKQDAEIYSFAGINFEPSRLYNLSPGLNKFQVKVYTRADIITQKGTYNFEYEVKGSVSGITKDKILIKIADLKDTLEIKASDLNINGNDIDIEVKNVQNTNLDNITLHFKSLFFDEEKIISISPLSSESLTLKIEKDKIKTLTSGSYVFDAEAELENSNIKFDSTFNYLPKEDSILRKSSDGFIIKKTTYNRTNIGNTVINGRIETSRDILSRLYTVNSVEPSQVERHALFATYVWEKSLKPGESYTISSTTNYTLPFVLVILIVVVGFLVKLYTRTDLIINKRVSYVKTKSGVFALKVKLHVRSKKYIENVQIIDRLPGMTQLYEKFGIKPDKIDHATKRMYWNIDKLNSGEERVFSYIIYSKVSVVGRFELPAATAIYQRDGKTEQVFSNRTFFVSETMRTDL